MPARKKFIEDFLGFFAPPIEPASGRRALRSSLTDSPGSSGRFPDLAEEVEARKADRRLRSRLERFGLGRYVVRGDGNCQIPLDCRSSPDHQQRKRSRGSLDHLPDLRTRQKIMARISAAAALRLHLPDCRTGDKPEGRPSFKKNQKEKPAKPNARETVSFPVLSKQILRADFFHCSAPANQASSRVASSMFYFPLVFSFFFCFILSFFSIFFFPFFLFFLSFFSFFFSFFFYFVTNLLFFSCVKEK